MCAALLYSYVIFHELWPAVLQDRVKIDAKVQKKDI